LKLCLGMERCKSECLLLKSGILYLCEMQHTEVMRARYKPY